MQGQLWSDSDIQVYDTCYLLAYVTSGALLASFIVFFFLLQPLLSPQEAASRQADYYKPEITLPAARQAATHAQQQQELPSSYGYYPDPEGQQQQQQETAVGQAFMQNPFATAPPTWYKGKG